MNKKILYITFVDFSEQKSGSSVRPKKIYEAFKNKGINVKLLEGQQNRKLERWKRVIKYFKEIRKEKYDACYIEPPSGPIFNFCDHLLMLYISKIKKIPLGVFYRDAFWKLSEWYSKKGIKTKIIVLMHKFDWMIIKYVSKVIYFPSESFANYFEFKNKIILMPGSEIIDNLKDGEDNTFIYVGGIDGAYGSNLLLDSFKKAFEKNNSLKLNLVCRGENDIIKRYKNEPWLNLHIGKSGSSELKKIYDISKYSIMTLIPGSYSNIAIPIKLFEYISYQKPIISTNCIEIEKIIKKYDIGIITNAEEYSLSEAILSMVTDSDAYSKYKINIINKVLKEELWENRVVLILNTLLN
ncbi:MAG: glycosyltransferase family 4 protein [Clostridium sartagoforme]|nr:glycosyltransferase family 4 protein [Clostridium sartagoforme]